MVYKEYTDIQQIKKQVEGILNGDIPYAGDYLSYNKKKTADKIANELQKEGVNCHVIANPPQYDGIRIYFPDVSKFIKEKENEKLNIKKDE